MNKMVVVFLSLLALMNLMGCQPCDGMDAYCDASGGNADFQSFAKTVTVRAELFDLESVPLKGLTTPYLVCALFGIKDTLTGKELSQVDSTQAEFHICEPMMGPRIEFSAQFVTESEFLYPEEYEFSLHEIWLVVDEKRVQATYPCCDTPMTYRSESELLEGDRTAGSGELVLTATFKVDPNARFKKIDQRFFSDDSDCMNLPLSQVCKQLYANENFGTSCAFWSYTTDANEAQLRDCAKAYPNFYGTTDDDRFGFVDCIWKATLVK